MQRLILLLFFLVPVILFAQESPTSYPPPPPPPPPPLADDLEVACYTFPEQMPTISFDTSECEQQAWDCSQRTIINFIYEHLKYGKEGCLADYSGTVVVQFTVEKDGLVSNYKVLRDIAGGCGDEALRVVKLMNKTLGPWTPGMQAGRAVNTTINLPVKIRLE